MDSTNNGKGYTNEQWESLLCRTFGDPAPAPKAAEPSKPEPVAQTPPTPAPPAPPAPKQEVPVPETPKPETPKKAAPVPAKPAPKKKRKIWTLVWILLAVSLVFAIIAVHVFPLEDDAPSTTKEQRQCMKALRQWQDAQSYKVSISTTIPSADAYISGYLPITESVYCYTDKFELNWTFTRYPALNSASDYAQYTGQAWIDGDSYSYSSGRLSASQWRSAEETIDISQPWIMRFSLNDVQIVDQHTYKQEDNRIISFSVIDLDPKDPYYDQGPYRVSFCFDAEGKLIRVTHHHSHYMTNNLTTTNFSFQEMPAKDVEELVKSQMRTPKAYPGLFIVETVPDFIVETVPDIQLPTD